MATVRSPCFIEERPPSLGGRGDGRALYGAAVKVYDTPIVSATALDNAPSASRRSGIGLAAQNAAERGRYTSAPRTLAATPTVKSATLAHSIGSRARKSRHGL